MLESEEQAKEKIPIDSTGVPPQDISQTAQERLLPPVSLRRRMWLPTKRVVAAILALIGLIAGADQVVGGPPWPTSPDVIPGPPDNSQAFNVPFTISNKSGFFRDYIDKSSCAIGKITLTGNNKIENMRFTVLSGSIVYPLQSRPFLCWFPRLIPGQVVSAIMYIEISYKIKFIWGFPKTSIIGPFVWGTQAKPPRWLKGGVIGIP